MDALERNTPLCWQGVVIAQNIRFSALEIGVIDGLRDLEVQRKGNKTSDQAQQKKSPNRNPNPSLSSSNSP